MCKTKAEGGRCAAHLRVQLSSARRTLAQREAEEAAIERSRYGNADSKDGYDANQEATLAKLDANTKINALQREYDSTRTGQDELAQQITDTSDEAARAKLETRLAQGKLLRKEYEAKAAHKDVADGIRDSDVQHSAVNHDATGATISMPTHYGDAHEVSIHADPEAPEESRYTLSVTTASQEGEDGQWNDNDATPPYMNGTWSRQEAIDHAVSYSREYLPRQTEVDQSETTSGLARAGIPTSMVKNSEGGSVRVPLPQTDPYYRRDIRITPHYDQASENRYTVSVTQSLPDDDGGWAPATYEPVPYAGPRPPAESLRTREQAVRDAAAYTTAQEGWVEQVQEESENDPWALGTAFPAQQDYDPAPF